MKRILVSACLLGEACRYDGASKPCEEVIALGRENVLVPVCPEVLGGLAIPRQPCEISSGKIRRCDGEDMTAEYERGAEKALEIAKKEQCSIAIFKEKSPSCGVNLIYDGSFQGTLITGEGITCALLRKNGISVYSENEIKKARSK
ncbi:MAG: DUF523 domain-containing protein [Clostridia bacterium]|nr:DUF523 domain-containing protein [Clostridia bacterium]